MLYLLYEWLKDSEAGKYLNVLKYPSTRIVAAGIASLILGMLVGPRLIEQLRFQQHGASNVREDVPDTHLKKKGTPTMGGALILACILLGTLLFADLRSRAVWVVALITMGYGFIGFLDDWLKLSKRNSKGLPGRWKIALQTFFFAVAVGCFLTEWSGPDGPHLLIDTRLTLPFIPTHWFNPNFGWAYIVLAWFLVVGTSNAVNITDGLDGLAIVPTIVSALTFAVLCYVAGTTLSISDIVEAGGVSRQVGIPLHERCPEARSWRSSARRWSAPESRSSGSTPTRPPSSWATSARSRWAAAWARWRCSPRTRSSQRSSMASSLPRSSR
jgi:phospho-N-acetylmuramoyl-pentapeptide-transferase